MGNVRNTRRITKEPDVGDAATIGIKIGDGIPLAVKRSGKWIGTGAHRHKTCPGIPIVTAGAGGFCDSGRDIIGQVKGGA